MTYHIFLTRKAKKQLEKLEKEIQKQIKEKLHEIENNNKPLYEYDIVKLQNEKNKYRLRIGDYRILFEYIKQEKEIIIFAILPRKNSYKI